MAKGSKSTAPNSNWLALFPFADLPLELQLLIGCYTMEYSRNISLGFYLSRKSCEAYFAPQGSTRPISLGLAHTCRALRVPLIKHFLRANIFDFQLHDNASFDWLLRKVGPEYLAMIESISAWWALTGSQDYLAVRENKTKAIAPHFCGLKVLKLRADSTGNLARDEERKLLQRTFFQVFPKLETILFCTASGKRPKEPMRIIIELALSPGAVERGVESVSAVYSEPEDVSEPLDPVEELENGSVGE